MVAAHVDPAVPPSPTSRAVPDPILYIGASVPTLSETFVWREILGLQSRGVRVIVASVHPPNPGDGDERLARMAAQTIPVYGAGPAAMLIDAASAAFRSPVRTLAVACRAIADACTARDLRPVQRPKVLWQCLAATALTHRVRDLGIRHIHAHMAHVPATIAMYCARHLGVGFSFTGHANDLFPNRALLEQKLSRARFVACISHWHREFYRTEAPNAHAALPIVRCGVETGPSSRPSAGTAPLILATGRFIPKKGFDLLLRALATINPAARVLLIGDGPQRPELERLARDLHLSNIEFAGARPHTQVLAALDRADLFALPCRVASDGDRDGIPVALMEAMARGLCVISGDLPAIRELVQHGDSGLLIPPGDLPALTQALRTVLDDPDLRARLGQQARAVVAREFDFELNITRLLDAFAAAGQPALAPKDSPCAA